MSSSFVSVPILIFETQRAAGRAQERGSRGGDRKKVPFFLSDLIELRRAHKERGIKNFSLCFKKSQLGAGLVPNYASKRSNPS